MKTCLSQPLLYDRLTQENNTLFCPQFCSCSLDHNTTKIKHVDRIIRMMKMYHKKVPVLGVTAEGV